MFGENPIRSQEPDPNTIAVQAVFPTIQGEGPQSGRLALFIRLAGCNLACWFCDTDFESNIHQVSKPAEFAACIERDFSPLQRELVVLTGGEPLRQAGALTLIAHLLASGTKLVQIETAGTLWLPGLERYIEQRLVQLVCSPKTPRVHFSIATYCKHWKYVVRAGEAAPMDGLPKRGTQLATRDKLQTLYRPISVRSPEAKSGADLLGVKETIWLSPCDEYDEAKNKANLQAAVALCLKHGYRLSLQVHKIIGVE